jgi:hypothetical protein
VPEATRFCPATHTGKLDTFAWISVSTAFSTGSSAKTMMGVCPPIMSFTGTLYHSPAISTRHGRLV